MTSIGASKVSLSSISSQALWQRSGRLDGHNAEFFKLEDRKKTKFLLSPTHEEEITSLVSQTLNSYKDLPLRLYQVTRKYRDEARPRQGLLRGREFIMKDLYTFDSTAIAAKKTYDAVGKAYRRFLDELGLPYLVANADSGNMGGSLSHEYHFSSQKGEDTVITCTDCDLSMNEELNVGRRQVTGILNEAKDVEPQIWTGLTKDGKTLVKAYLPSGDHAVNPHAIKALYPEMDFGTAIPPAASGEMALEIVVLIDPRVSRDVVAGREKSALVLQPTINLLTKARQGDACPSCASGRLQLQQAIEIGHTFYLGQRYSIPLNAAVLNAANEMVHVEMGCHGIGVSRLIAAAASLLADERGLNWPLSFAPFGVLLMGAGNTSAQDVYDVYDSVTASGVTDVVIEDRDKPMGWKLNDADLVGYPFIIVLGRAWKQKRAVELQCRRLKVKEEVPVDELCEAIRQYSDRL